MRPSFARPPLAVKNVMNGVVWAPRLAVLSTCRPGIAVSSAPYERVAGSVLMTSLLSTAWRRALCVSTTGVSPLTVIVSSTAPTFRSALIVMTPDPLTLIASRLTVLKPVSENVSV